ncbi:amine sulfotransferase [Galendromus occidentalis]|uniref:Amine sulfotransferase n=1 Tax=Galendromus occidentalis TaxID=34638 RepID=A0AAJ6VV58_9ACAR|nr:amine sulfotransferase [Galendromus occidentalis]
MVDDYSSVEVPSLLVNGVRFPDVFPRECVESAIKHRAHDEDLIVCTYPKSGTTWVQYILCYLLHYDEFDGTVAKMNALCPFVDHFGTDKLKPGMMYKQHLPFNPETFNDKSRLIIVVRNPRDVAISFYHFVTLLPPKVPGVPEGANWFKRFSQLFVRGEVWYGDYMEWHRGWLEGARKYGKPENILFVVYEKMKKDPRKELIRIANFLGEEVVELIKDEKVIETILEKTHVRSMKEAVNESYSATLDDESGEIPEVVEFVRKGTVGDHVNYFTPEISKMFDEYIASDPRNREIMDMFDV